MAKLGGPERPARQRHQEQPRQQQEAGKGSHGRPSRKKVSGPPSERPRDRTYPRRGRRSREVAARAAARTWRGLGRWV
jgi:hypothetical protein